MGDRLTRGWWLRLFVVVGLAAGSVMTSTVADAAVPADVPLMLGCTWQQTPGACAPGWLIVTTYTESQSHVSRVSCILSNERGCVRFRLDDPFLQLSAGNCVVASDHSNSPAGIEFVIDDKDCSGRADMLERRIVQPDAPLQVHVPGAVGGGVVLGNVAVDEVSTAGFVTAYACAAGIPRDDAGRVSRADLNFDGRVSPVWSNRLVVSADANGDICFYVSSPAALIVDVNALTNNAITTIPNQRTDTRAGAGAVSTLQVHVPGAVGGGVVLGNVAVDEVSTAGFVTAYACAAGIPRDDAGRVSRADLNFDGRVSPVWSNRLVVSADANGDICFYVSSPAALIVDVNALTNNAITTIPNQRTDTRAGAGAVSTLQVHVPGAVGGGVVLGNVAVDEVSTAGFVTAYACAAGIPRDDAGRVSRADLNFDGRVSPVWSNRLVVSADANGDICFYVSSPAALIVDVNALTTNAITTIPNQRTDTRTRPR